MIEQERPRAFADGFAAPAAAPRRRSAVLVYDSRRQARPAGAGARAHDPNLLRQLYAAGELEIELEFDGSSLTGWLRVLRQNVVDEADLAAAWVVVTGPSGWLETGMDKLAQFSLRGVEPGRHRLELRLGGEVIEIPDLQL